MKDYELLDALGGIDPDYVKSAGLSSLRGRQRKLTGFLAAASVLILAIGTLYLLRNGWIAGRIGCGRGGNEGPVYMSYAGPVFPLSLMEADEDISAERAIHFDFSPYRSLTETYEDENGWISLITGNYNCFITKYRNNKFVFELKCEAEECGEYYNIFLKEEAEFTFE